MTPEEYEARLTKYRTPLAERVGSVLQRLRRIADRANDKLCAEAADLIEELHEKNTLNLKAAVSYGNKLASETERCAKIAEGEWNALSNTLSHEYKLRHSIAAAIRAKGGEK